VSAADQAGGAELAVGDEPSSDSELDALLVALVLDASTYSRNRFFDLHKTPGFRRARRRASLVRSVVRHACARGVSTTSAPGGGSGGVPQPLEQTLSIVPDDDGWSVVTYSVPRLGLRRITRMDALEVSLLRFAMARARGGELAADDVDRARVEDALRGLAEPRGLGRAPDPVPPTPAPAAPQESGLWDPP
jgi:hypothetical protein